MNLKDLSFEETKALANSVEGFTFHHMTGEVKLKEDLAVYLEANPDKIPVPTYEPPENGEGNQGDNTPPVIPDGALVNERPIVVPDEPQLPPNEQGNSGETQDKIPPEENIDPDALVKVKSVYRGEIASSFGMLDFGTDGIVEVSAEAAEMLCTLEGYKKC